MTEFEQKEMNRLEGWKYFGYAVLWVAGALLYIGLMHWLFGPESYDLSPGE